MGKYLLAHDLGTSGNKATLFTIDGEMLKSKVYSYDTNYFNGNWAEQNPDDWWKAVCHTTREIVQRIDPHDIAAISFSGQMMGCLCVDKTGTPLKESIIWADQRSTVESQHIREKMGDECFYNITGHRISPSYGLEKFMWIKNNQPDVYKDTYKILNAKDYIIHKLTDRFVTDFSDASGTCAMDLNKLEWSTEIVKASEIDGQKLPDIVASIEVVGEVTSRAAEETGLYPGTPVVCGGGDGVCAAVGAGCVKQGDAYLYIGSSSWISLANEKPILDKGMRTFNWAHIVPGLIAPCGTMQSAGGSYNWLKNEICTMESYEAAQSGVSPYKLIDDEIEKSPIGSNGLLFLPYLLGERSPWWNPEARGAFIGLKMEHKRKDVLRSVLEGVALNLNIILTVFKEHVEIDEITVIGGGAKGEIWTQIMADVFNLKIVIPNHIEEATSMGAAVTGGVGAGVFKNFDAIHDFVKTNREVIPISRNNETYSKLKIVFEQSYNALTEVYSALAKL